MERPVKIFVVMMLVLFWCGPIFSQENPLKRIHFLSNSFEILSEQQTTLHQNIEWFQKNPKAVLILEGHCDEWGKDSYNMQLGDLRAREVKAAMIEQGVDPERIIMVVSYGEFKPLDERKIQEAWNLNRRVEFVIR